MITNLVTLCKFCHLEIHDYNFYGPVNISLTNILKDYIQVYYSQVQKVS